MGDGSRFLVWPYGSALLARRDADRRLMRRARDLARADRSARITRRHVAQAERELSEQLTVTRWGQ